MTVIPMKGSSSSALATGKVVLTVSDVRKSFGNMEVLKGVSFDVMDREVLCLIGSSGSGKSTMLRCINHIETINAGEISFKNEVVGYVQRGDALHEASEGYISKQRQRIGMVFQNFNLFGHMTALENVASGPILVKGVPRKVANEKAAALLDRVGLADRGENYPAQLSGGQQQRVAIARALAMDPEMLLLDEPTSALDPELVQEVLDTIRSLAEGGMTMVIVTHEMGLVRDIADRVIFMRDGAILESGPTAEFFENPKSDVVKKFLHRQR
ncbi:polar amino acid transport system ATP-binding protein [Neorhizobium galegae]|uniref:amino acid ABC transporter ATP-binding protein n=1 Tax=Neorhizobium galegae TaxID=399 RepID=UPI0027831C1B|nr:amino acid ABC transporter ATP-binding protein [Neorhizobium galegae]MDQ0137709.1 polar amino acid transport system ATP-binding protein [Neorhizobium galegae]